MHLCGVGTLNFAPVLANLASAYLKEVSADRALLGINKNDVEHLERQSLISFSYISYENAEALEVSIKTRLPKSQLEAALSELRAIASCGIKPLDFWTSGVIDSPDTNVRRLCLRLGGSIADINSSLFQVASVHQA